MRFAALLLAVLMLPSCRGTPLPTALLHPITPPDSDECSPSLQWSGSAFDLDVAPAGEVVATRYQYTAVYSDDGVLLREFGNSRSEFAAVGGDGTLYCVNPSQRIVRLFSLAGVEGSRWTIGGGVYPFAAAISGSTLLLLDRHGFGTASIALFSLSGDSLGRWDGVGVAPTTIAAGANGEVFLGEPGVGVRRYSSTGVLLSSWACDPASIAYDRRGGVLVEDAARASLVRYTGAGAEISSCPNGRATEELLVADGPSSIYVADRPAGMMMRFSKGGVAALASR